MAQFDREALSGHSVASTTDLDEAREAVRSVYLPNRLELLNRDTELDMRLNAVRIGNVTMGYLRYGRDVRLVTAEAQHYHINVPLSGDTESRCGSREPVHATTRSATVFMPDSPAEIRWRSNCAQLCLMINRAELELELESLLGRPVTGPVEFATSMNLTARDGRNWVNYLAMLMREFEGKPTLLRHPLAARNLERLLIDGLLLGQPHNYSEVLGLPRPPAPPRAVKEAIDLLYGHPEHAWSTAALARDVAVSARSLQEGFHRAVDIPPMTYLREIRLNRVHAELEAAPPGTTTVTEVASRWGFVHLGRFASAYRRKFGHAPSETLRVA